MRDVIRIHYIVCRPKATVWQRSTLCHLITLNPFISMRKSETFSFTEILAPRKCHTETNDVATDVILHIIVLFYFITVTAICTDYCSSRSCHG